MIATPTPIDADPLAFAAPLATAEPSVSLWLVSANAPAALKMPAPIAARAEDLWMLIAMAAATEMPPRLVDGRNLLFALFTYIVYSNLLNP